MQMENKHRLLRCGDEQSEESWECPGFHLKQRTAGASISSPMHPTLTVNLKLFEEIKSSCVIFEWNENRHTVYSRCVDPCEFIIRDANNVHIVFKRKEAGNETVSFDDAGVSLLLFFGEDEQF